jgi:TPR repeat protein
MREAEKSVMRERIKVGLLALAVSMGLAAPATAGALEEGLAAYGGGDYTTTLQLLRQQAEQGDAAALLNLGIMFDFGRGAPQDDAEAVKWHRKAAELGDATAMFNLGVMLEDGRGAAQDYVEAYKWFNLATARLSPSTQAELRDDAVKHRDLLARKMTAAQIAQAQQRPEIGNQSNLPKSRNDAQMATQRPDVGRRSARAQ